MAEKTSKELEDIKKEAESMLILGIFSIVIGAILFFAIIFTDTAPGKWANFGVGLVLLLLGGSIYFKGRKMGKGPVKAEK